MSFRIYVACLAAYNNGILHGEWIDLMGKDAEDVRAEIARILKESPEPDADEWAVHDSETPGFDCGEYPDIDELMDHCHCMMNSCYDYDLIEGVCDHQGITAKEAIDYIEDNYQGVHQDLSYWAEEILNDCGGLSSVPNSLRFYIDFEAYGRDAELGGDIFTIRTKEGVHVLWSR